MGKIRKNTENKEKYLGKLGKIQVRPKRKKKVLTQIGGKIRKNTVEN